MMTALQESREFFFTST